MKITMNDFKTKKIAVRVGLIHLEEFLEMCEAEGLRWSDKKSATEGIVHTGFGRNLTIGYNFFQDGYLGFCDPKFYLKEGWIVVDFDDVNCRCSQKPCPCPEYQIIITCWDDTTHADMFVNGHKVKETKAKRNPADKFNWKIGAQTAFKRLWEKKKKPMPAVKVDDGCVEYLKTITKINYGNYKLYARGEW